MNPFWRNLVLYSFVVLVIASLVYPLFTVPPKSSEMSFSHFVDAVEQEKVKEVTIGENRIEGKLKDGKPFYTQAVNYPNLIAVLRDKKVDIHVQAPTSPSWWSSLLVQLVIPLLFIAGFWYLLFRQAQGVSNQALSFGRSRARPVAMDKNKVTFADVAGVDEAKQELYEIVEFLKTPEKFQNLGARIPKGVLLMGAPGTGKTLLARAIAGEANVPFFSLSGSDFVEMFVGVGASRVRDLFSQAKKQTPCIIFVDEIDAVGRHRGAGLGGGHDEREQTLNQLLVEMDGFDPKTNIVIIAATNRPDILDPALLRPGRFDRQVVVDKPDVKGREEILKIHAKEKPLLEGIDLAVLARRTPGFTGADLENIMNEAAILAARRDKQKIGMEELEEAVDRVMAGPEKKSRLLSEKEKEIVAYHEVGHALVAKLLPGADPVHKVSILPRGMALGYTLQLPLVDKYLVSKKEAVDRMTVMMGGRVAEELIFGDVTSGAHDDLQKATELARRMVCEFGMSDLGARTFGKKHEQVFLGRDITESRDYGDVMADEIDKQVRILIDSSYGRAKKLLSDYRGKLDEIAGVLKEKETLEGEALEALLNGGPATK